MSQREAFASLVELRISRAVLYRVMQEIKVVAGRGAPSVTELVGRMNQYRANALRRASDKYVSGRAAALVESYARVQEHLGKVILWRNQDIGGGDTISLPSFEEIVRRIYADFADNVQSRDLVNMYMSGVYRATAKDAVVQTIRDTIDSLALEFAVISDGNGSAASSDQHQPDADAEPRRPRPSMAASKTASATPAWPKLPDVTPGVQARYEQHCAAAANQALAASTRARAAQLRDAMHKRYGPSA